MKIGVTGGTGFLGSFVVEAISRNGWHPFILSRKKSKEYQTIQTDYSIKDLTEKIKGFDAIVHLAYERKPYTNISGYHQSEQITQNVYEACVNNSITNIVFASTISVYGSQNDLPWQEIHLPTPNTLYGISKYSSELLGNKYSEIEGLKIKNLRFAHLFGFNEKNNYMLNLFMRRAFNNNTLYLNSNSSSKREFLFIEDAASAIIKALYYEHSGTFNIGNSNIVLTNEEVAKNINTTFENYNNIMIKNPKKPDETSNSFMVNIKAKRTLQFEAQYNFENALEKIFKCMKELKDVPNLY